LNTAQSALSCILKPVNGITFGAHPTVTRFLKGVFESRPTVSRYTETWDVGTVLRHLKTIPKTRDVPLKDLTLKTVVLMSLVSAQRGQTIHMLNLEDMTSKESQITFHAQPFRGLVLDFPLPTWLSALKTEFTQAQCYLT